MVVRAVQTDPITAALEKARAAGAYQFTSDITQVTIPTMQITNVGRSSRSEQLHLAGQTDLRQQSMEMQLWSDGGSVLQAGSGIGVKVAAGKTFVRQGQGDWQEKPDFSVDSLAPQGDFMAYLTALRNVQAHAPEQRNGIQLTRYSFTVDGPAFAAYSHAQLEQTLRAKGELPADMQLEVPRYYQEMTGDGELWIGADGLPLRQILNLQFPPQKDEQVQSQMVTDFSKYGTPDGAASGISGQWSTVSGQFVRDTTPIFFTLLAGFGLLFVAIRYGRSRKLYNGLAIAVMLSMVVGPLLTTTTKVHFFDTQTAKAAQQEEEQAVADQERDLREALGRVEFDPHRNPIEIGDQRLETSGSTVEASLQSPISSPQTALPADNGVDTDGDTLSDFVEQRVGTAVAVADTDNDGLRDNLEVRGFTLGGKQWYLNPNALDSNSDGQGDALEWGLAANGAVLATPQDTDGDGTPDLFDPDNDNDGVTDRRDLSPYVANATVFAENAPLQLRLDNLTAGKPTFVEFQLRPQDPKHLSFAFNVLDWPQESAGQVQDVDNKSYADVATAQARVPDANESNGDLKLFPMLEIRMPTAGANLPPQSDLTPFNITVNNYSADGATKVAYVPLTLVKDEATGQRVAFSGQMRYLPGGTWPSPHDVRLVWGVQVLTDRPCDPQDAQQVTQGCQPDGYIHNVPQMIHTYYDAWTLTGLTVREEHGTSMDLIYEDPAVDANKKDDAALWALSFVLDHHFALGRDENGDGQRDLTVNEIANRFDRTRNAAYTDDQRFAVPNGLRVAQQTYTTFDQAVAATTMTETVNLLNTVFAPAVTADRAIKPLIMFAQENSARSMTLDGLRAGGGYVSQSGAGVTIDMAPAGQPAQSVNVTAGLKWTAYCVPDSGALTWQSCPADLYWETLEGRYGALPMLPGETDRTYAEGRLQLAQLYYTGFNAGYYGTVQQGSQIVTPAFVLENAATTTQSVRSNLGGLSSLLLVATGGLQRSLSYPLGRATVDNQLLRVSLWKFASTIKEQLANNAELARSAGKDIKLRSIPQMQKLRIYLLRFYVTPLAVAGAVLSVTSQILSLSPDISPTGRGVISGITASITAGLNVIMPLVEVGQMIRAGTLASQLLTRAVSLSRLAKIGGGVGLALALGVTWGVFIYSAATSGYAAGSPEINQAFAGAVAATIYILLTTLLASTVIGGIIAAIIAVIDLILTAICEAGADSLRNVPGLGGSCFTLGAGAIKVLTYLIYNYDSMINTDRTDLVVMGAADINLADPSKGYVAGNTLSVNLPITTTIVHKNPDASNGVLINAFLYLFSEANLRSSTYKYSLTAPDKQDIVVARDQMPGAWAVRERNADEGGEYVATTMYRGQASTNPPAPVTGIPLQAGINRPAEFYFNMGYAIPAYECWMMPLPFLPFVPPIPVCYARELAGANSSKMDNIKFDIFPATLDGFMTVTSNGDGGLRLAWDAGFPSLKDADGDGLLSNVYRGLDPNDNNTDADNDGLSDTYELEHRQAGFALSPVSCDSDLDGLTDEQEMQLNSDPGVADSDNDGLLDGQEVWHRIYSVTTTNNQTTCAATANWSGGWDVRINATSPFVVHVSSDPLIADTDSDGLSDLAEKQLAESTCTAQEVTNGRTCEGNPLKPVDNQNRPFHPNLFNTPPLSLILATNDFDGFLAPNQTLRYTTTVIANAPLAPGVLDVLPPVPPFAAPPAPLPLPFNSLTFSGSQTVTVPSNLTVQSSATTQDIVVSSRARTRLASSSGAALVFDPVALEPALGGFTAPLVARNTALSANRPDRTDSYLLNSLLSSSATAGGAGDIQSYSLPGGASRVLEADNLNKNMLRGANAPRSTSNNRGDSLVVWDEVENCRTLNITLLSIVTAGPDHGTSGIEPYITVRDSAGNQDVRVWNWTSVQPVDLGVGTYAQGFPVTVNICGDYTIKMWESDGNGDESVGAISRTQAVDLNGTVTFEGAGHKIAIDVNTPYRDDYTIAGALVGADGTVKRRITFPTSPLAIAANQQRRSFSPAVASDGTNFLVAYETRNSTEATGYVVQPVSSDGTASTPTLVSLGNLTFDTVRKLGLDLAWVGTRYRVLYARLGDLFYKDFTSTGAPVADGPWNLAFNHDFSPTPHPSLAWDAQSGRWAVAYMRVNGNPVQLYRYPNIDSRTQDASATFASAYKQVDLAWNPLNSGWIFQGQLTDNRQVFVALDADLVQRAANATQTSWTGADSAGLALACPAVTAQPVLDLRFEELPGTTSFVDSSGRNNNAVCGSASQCPAAGAPGGVYANGTAIGTPGSDYALTFNSNQYLRLPNNATLAFDANRSFTWLAWVKTTVGSPIMRKGLGGANDVLLAIDGGDGRLRAAFNNLTGANILADNGLDLRDDKWHLVGVTLDRANNTATLIVDGSQRSSKTITGNFVTGDDLFIGSSNVAGYVGALDNVQIYHSALAGDAISALYNRTMQAYCVGSSPTATGNGVQWAKLIVRQPDLRGGAITASNSLNLTVDGDQPTASLTSLPNAATVQGGSSAAPRILVIGGTATDPTSSVGQVEVSVNNGAWQVADGAESWTFALPLTDGQYEIRTRATDAVGNIQTNLATITLFADGTLPQMSVTTDLAVARRTFRTIDARYNLLLQGSARDPATGGSLGQLSGVIGQVQLFDAAGQAVGEPQRVGLNPDTSWQIFYRFPDGEKAPAGRYFIELQATDRIGNQFKQRLANSFVIDGLGPVATLTKTNLNTGALAATITDTVTIGGQISETAGVASANVSFTPIQQVLPYADNVLQLNLDEQSPGVTVAGPLVVEHYADGSTQFNHALCISRPQCPVDSVAGRVGRALSFNGNQYLRVLNHPTLNFNESTSFSWQVWVKTNSTLATNPILRKGLGERADLLLALNSGGQVQMRFGDIGTLTAGPNLRDNQWHQIVVTLNRPNNRAEIYVDGVGYGGGTFPGNYTTPDDLLIGSGNFQGYQGELDQIAIFRHSLNAAEVQALYQSVSRPLYPATVTGTTAWTRQVPTGLEGFYQLDLPATDTVGNDLANGNLWRGLIDTMNPRITLAGRATGQSYLDTATNTQRYEIVYTCRAEDFHLNEATFNCAGNTQRSPAKSFNSDALLKQQFPDLTLLSTLVNTYTVWAASPTPTDTLTACDAYGHCTTATSTSSATDVAAAAELVEAASAPSAVIVAPTNGSALAGSGDLAVTVAAEAAQHLKEIQLLLDGADVGKLNFEQAANLQNILRTLTIPMPGAGEHLLTVRVTDWAGGQAGDSTPVRITVYSAAPVITLATTALSVADSYGAGSNIYRLHGTVSDATLDAVKVKVGDQPAASAPVVNGEWRIAYPVFNTGAGLTVSVQASNAAGQTSQTSNPVTLDETGGQPIETFLQETPTNPSGENVSFHFKGNTLGDAELLVGQCNLDNSAYIPCTRPQAYSGLSMGEHTFRVRAVDSQGFVDPTPASFTWTVQGSEPLVVLEESPTMPTTSRAANFRFRAPSLSDASARYDCQLDGGSFAPCTSPQPYANLADGTHTFQVRAKAQDGAVPGTPTRFVWTVNNATPLVTDQTIATNQDTAVAITLVAGDEDALTYKVGTPAHGVLVGIPPALTYSPNTGYTGPDSFTFTASDGLVESNLGTITLDVQGSTTGNQAPVAVDDGLPTTSEIVAQGRITLTTLLDNDSDPDDTTPADGNCTDCSIVAVGQASQGTVTLSGLGVTYVATNRTFLGTDTFTYTVADNDPRRALTDSAQVAVTVQADAVAGDCNANGTVDAGDLTALGLEIFDGDGNRWYDAAGGSVAFSPYGCDANADAVIDAGDLTCTARRIFATAFVCGSVVAAQASPATLAIGSDLFATLGTTVDVPLVLDTGGQAVAATAFSLHWEAAHLGFDPTDANADGIPDAVTFHLPSGLLATATYHAAASRLDIIVLGIGQPFAQLGDGPLATVRLTVPADSTQASTALTLSTASLGGVEGQSLPLTVRDGAVQLSTQTFRLLLPLVSR